jgi:hypothetical protein
MKIKSEHTITIGKDELAELVRSHGEVTIPPDAKITVEWNDVQGLIELSWAEESDDGGC